MVVIRVPKNANISLAEHDVGAASETIVYPGIRQCFALAGWTQGEILGFHVSPDFTADDMSDGFKVLKELGGDKVMYWYVVGPFIDHFAVGKAQWRCVGDIKKTFVKHFKNPAATHLILDASTERHTKRLYAGIDIPMSFSAINIRVWVRGITTAFAYQEWGGGVNPWNEFDLRKFTRF